MSFARSDPSRSTIRIDLTGPFDTVENAQEWAKNMAYTIGKDLKSVEDMPPHPDKKATRRAIAWCGGFAIALLMSAYIEKQF
jgi:hypothetical protein